uniref:CCHC-type domain-containing protein n=1 Tax=Timema monikensis TaxID=170555 RepID=A0A7R9HSS6_9NEOP|nr:unnamed protein product [Timema monikensis]
MTVGRTPGSVVERSKGVAFAVDLTADDGEIGFQVPVGKFIENFILSMWKDHIWPDMPKTGRSGQFQFWARSVIFPQGSVADTSVCMYMKPIKSCMISTALGTRKRMVDSEVKSVHPYGAFVQMPGAVVQGLVHRTQVSSVSVSDVSEVLQPGERVWCKVINITDDNKLALSMKVVDQGNGMDLDPNGVQIEQDERRRKAHPSGTGRRIIELGAVLNTTCSKCGVHGHLANECFRSPDGKTYALVEEEKDDMPTLVSEPPQEVKHIAKDPQSELWTVKGVDQRVQEWDRRARAGLRVRGWVGESSVCVSQCLACGDQRRVKGTGDVDIDCYSYELC